MSKRLRQGSNSGQVLEALAGLDVRQQAEMLAGVMEEMVGEGVPATGAQSPLTSCGLALTDCEDSSSDPAHPSLPCNKTGASLTLGALATESPRKAQRSASETGRSGRHPRHAAA